jgi:hypothetical protein
MERPTNWDVENNGPWEPPCPTCHAHGGHMYPCLTGSTPYHPHAEPRSYEGDYPDYYWHVDMMPVDENGTLAPISLACTDCGAGPDDDHSVCCPEYWKRLLTEAICAVIGHDLEDHGHAGPESGSIQIGCNRCGFEYPTHHLY